MAPVLIQSAAITGTASPTTLTLLAPTTAGNCIVVCTSGNASGNAPSVTGITIGGSADHFAVSVTAGTIATLITSIWADPGCTGGQTSVAVSFSSTGTAAVIIEVMEWSGLATSAVVDKTSGASTTSASWSSGSTATTTQVTELAIGAVTGATTGTVTGPVAPWQNLPQVVNTPGGISLLTGFDFLYATGTVAYAGSFGASDIYTAVVATFFTTPAPVPVYSSSTPIGIVQHVQNAGSGVSTLTTSIAATGTGNCLIVTVGCPIHTGFPTSMTIGGVASNFAVAVADNAGSTGVAIWACPNAPPGQTSVVVNLAVSDDPLVNIYEVAGLALASVTDRTSLFSASSSAWTSGATPVMGEATEIAFGVMCGFDGLFSGPGPVMTGPASPWVNSVQQTDATWNYGLSGYNILSIPAAITYAGTSNLTSPNNVYSAAVATFRSGNPVDVVQYAQNLSTTATTTVTMPFLTTAGNCLVVVTGTDYGTTDGTVSGVTLGGSADNFAYVFTAGNTSSDTFMQWWADQSCAGGQTAVVVTTSGIVGAGNSFVTVLEVRGLAPVGARLLDQSSGVDNSSVSAAAFTSGVTGITTYASELWVGAVGCGFSSPPTATPSGAWVNTPQQNSVSGDATMLTSYQVATVRQPVVYSGTYNVVPNWDAGVITLIGFQATPGPPVYPRPSNRVVTVPFFAGVTGVQHSR